MQSSPQQSWLTVRVIALVMATATLAMGGCTVKSVRHEVNLASTMTPPVLALYNEAVAAAQAGDVQKAREQYQAALEQARALGDDVGIGASLLALGAMYGVVQQYPQALEFLYAALPYAKNLARFMETRGIPAQMGTNTTVLKVLTPQGLILMIIGVIHAQMGNDASALAAFDQALAIWGKAVGETVEQEKVAILSVRATILYPKAVAHKRLGQWPEAVEHYRRVAADFQALGNQEGAGTALWEAAEIVHQKMGVPQQAIELYTQAWPLLQEAGKGAEATRVQFELGLSHMEVGNLQEAVAVFSEVVKMAEHEKLSALAIVGYSELGRAFEGLGEFEQTLASYQTLLQRLRQGDWQSEPKLEPEILVHKGKIHRLLSQYEEAIEHFHAAAVKYREAQDANGEADALTQLAEVFFWLVDHKTAVRYYKQALGLYQVLGNLPKQTEVLAALAESSWLSGDIPSNEIFEYLRIGEKLLVLGQESQEKQLSPEEYMRLWGECLKTLPSHSLAYRLAAGTLYQKEGRILLEARELDLAVSMLGLALVCHTGLPDNRDTTIEKTKDLYYLAEAYRQKGNSDLALKSFRGAEHLASLLRTPESHWVYAGLGRTYVDMGDAVNAMHHYKKALALLEVVQGQQGTEEIKIGALEGALDAYRGFVAALLDLYRKTGEEQYLHEAFQYSEKLKARAFLDMLGKSHATRLGGEAGWLAGKEEALRRQVARIHRQLRAPNLDKTEETQLLDQRESLRESWRTMQRQAVQQSPKYAQLVLPRPVTLEEIQSILDADSVLLEYATGPERSTLWVITNDQVHTYSLPGQEGVALLEQYLKTVREPLIGSDEVAQHVALSQQLYQGLIGQAEPHIRGKKHLIVVPDGLLYYLPFEALIVPEPQGGAGNLKTLADAPYLVKQFRVTYVPSASVLVAQHRLRISRGQTAQFPLLAFGDPVYREETFTGGPDSQMDRVAHLGLRGVRLNRLEFSGDEVQRIARLWGVPLTSPHINLRDRATVGRVRELDLSQYRILHFATHAVLGDEVRWATQPALILSQKRGGENTDGLLPFADILDLKLNAELVVLSACDTGLGRLRAGEGIVGLTRAFLYAGASAVVVSLWKVEDQSTGLLMEGFYRHLKQGKSKAEALRQAKLEVLQATITLKATGTRQPLASPFYWAPFILVGDGD